MAAELNELLEEGITRCGELADAVDAAMDAVDETAEQAKETGERVQQEATEARDHIRDLVGRLEKAEDAMGAARQEAEAALESLSDKGAALRREVGGLVERARDAAAQLEEQRGRIADSLDAQMAATQDGFSRLERKTEELEEEANQILTRASDTISAFRGTLESAQAEFAQKKDAWDGALELLELNAQQQISAWVAGLQGLLQRQASAMVSAANTMVDRHNDAMDVIRREFAGETPQVLAAALELVQTSFRGVAEEAAAREEALTSNVQSLEAAIDGQHPALADLKAALEGVADLG
jgi:chromosome segregation ATPase